jgi:hypothetical protein
MALAVAETAAAGGYLTMAAAVEYPATYQNPESVPLLLLFLSLLPVATNGSLQESEWKKTHRIQIQCPLQVFGFLGFAYKNVS